VTPEMFAITTSEDCLNCHSEERSDEESHFAEGQRFFAGAQNDKRSNLFHTHFWMGKLFNLNLLKCKFWRDI